MKITIPRLRRTIRRVIKEQQDDYLDYPSQSSGQVTLEVDLYELAIQTGVPFDDEQFEANCVDYGGCTIDDTDLEDDILRISGSFDALWKAWRIQVGDEPDEFLRWVIEGHQNCPIGYF